MKIPFSQFCCQSVPLSPRKQNQQVPPEKETKSHLQPEKLVVSASLSLPPSSPLSSSLWLITPLTKLEHNSSHLVSIWIGPNWSAPAWNYLNPILVALHHLSWPHGPQKYPLTHFFDLGPDQQEFVLQPPVNRLADSLSTHHISSHHRTTDTGTAPLTLVAHPAWSQSTDPAWSDSGSPGSLPCRSFLVCQLVCLWSVLSGLPLLDATLRGFIGIHLCH